MLAAGFATRESKRESPEVKIRLCLAVVGMEVLRNGKGVACKGREDGFLALKEFYWLLGLGLWLKSTTREKGKLGMEASSLPCRRIGKEGKPLLSANWSIPLFRF